MENAMIKKATEKDLNALAGMAVIMWDSHSTEELVNEFMEILNNDEAQVFLKFIQNSPVGFAQCGLRHDYVEGTESSPVGYLEGIFVKEEYRHHGYAKELLSACEQWAKEQGCTEFASDCELFHDASLKFHKAMGFQEVNRIICFNKPL